MTGRPRTQIGHGVYAWAKAEKCRCTPCLDSVARYTKAQRYDIARGHARRVSAEPARRHVQGLIDDGALPIQVARAAGLERSVIRTLMGTMGNKPASTYLHRTTANKILRVTLADALGENALVDATGVRRRIEALEWLGHTKAIIARAIGVSTSQVHLYVGYDRVTLATRRRVDDAYHELSRIPGSSEYIRWRAYRSDYKPPMAWDDETIDDPAAEPGPVKCVVATCSRTAVELSLCAYHTKDYLARHPEQTHGRHYRRYVQRVNEIKAQRTRGALDLAVQDLQDVGISTEEAAARLGVPLKHINKHWRNR